MYRDLLEMVLYQHQNYQYLSASSLFSLFAVVDQEKRTGVDVVFCR